MSRAPNAMSSRNLRPRTGLLLLLAAAGLAAGVLYLARGGLESGEGGENAGDALPPDANGSETAEPPQDLDSSSRPAPVLEIPSGREELASPEAPTGTSVPSAPEDSAPVRGLLTDGATGEPLAYYALRIRDASGRREELSTDDRGRFATAAPMASGALRIQPVDSVAHPRSLPEIIREHRAKGDDTPEVDLEVPTGPTYRLAIEPAEAAAPTEIDAGLHVASLDAKRALDAEPVRPPVEGDAPWIRFAPVPEPFDRAESIEVESRDGLWVGSAPVSAVRGIVPGVVAIRLEPRGVLQGRAVDTEGKPVPGARIVLEETTAAGKTAREEETTGKDGAYRFAALRAGTGTLSARSIRHAPQDVQVSVVAGQIAIQDFVLSPLPSAGEVRGRIESETGTYEPAVEVVLRPIAGASLSDSGPRPQTVRASWSSVEGRRTGTFAFEDLPAGKYELGLRSGGWFRWDPRTTVVSPPSAETCFVAHDDLAQASFAFRARDSDGGGGLDGFHAWIQVDGAPPETKTLASGASALSRFPLERRFRWRIDLDGFRPASGDEKSFSLEEVHDSSVWRIAEVDLVRGWGETFRVVSSAKGKPVAGASVVLDGRPAGTTGSDGTVFISSPVKPRDVDVEFKDWRPTAPVDLRPPWWRREKRFVLVKLAPPARK